LSRNQPKRQQLQAGVESVAQKPLEVEAAINHRRMVAECRKDTEQNRIREVARLEFESTLLQRDEEDMTILSKAQLECEEKLIIIQVPRDHLPQQLCIFLPIYVSLLPSYFVTEFDCSISFRGGPCHVAPSGCFAHSALGCHYLPCVTYLWRLQSGSVPASSPIPIVGGEEADWATQGQAAAKEG
jgi:hypothetical protein